MVVFRLVFGLLICLPVSQAQSEFSADINWSQFRSFRQRSTLRLETPAEARQNGSVEVSWEDAKWGEFGLKYLAQFEVYGRYHTPFFARVQTNRGVDYEYRRPRMGESIFKDWSVYGTDSPRKARINQKETSYSVTFPENVFADVFERPDGLDNPIVLLETALRDGSTDGTAVESAPVIQNLKKYYFKKIFISVFDNRNTTGLSRSDRQNLDDYLRWCAGFDFVTIFGMERHLIINVAYLSDGTVIVPQIRELAYALQQAPGQWPVQLRQIEKDVAYAQARKNVRTMQRAYRKLLEFTEFRMLVNDAHAFEGLARPKDNGEIDRRVLDQLANWRYQEPRVREIVSGIEAFLNKTRER